MLVVVWSAVVLVVVAAVVGGAVVTGAEELGGSAVIPVDPPEHAVANIAMPATTPTTFITDVRGATAEKVPPHSHNPRSIALRRMYAFAMKPKWIAGHALFLVLLAIFVAAGLWQLSRHNSRSDVNHTIQARASEPVLPLNDIVPAMSPSEAEFRIVAAAGEFTGPDVVIRSKPLDGQPGCHILSTLDTGQVAVVVNRGWLPLSVCEANDRGVAPPTGAVTIEGRVQATQRRGRFGAIDPPDGVLTTMARVDLDRIQAQTEQSLASVYLEQITPIGAGLPTRLREPATDAGPHLGYMVQWFSFAAVAVVGYPLVLRKQARSHDDD